MFRVAAVEKQSTGSSSTISFQCSRLARRQLCGRISDAVAEITFDDVQLDETQRFSCHVVSCVKVTAGKARRMYCGSQHADRISLKDGQHVLRFDLCGHLLTPVSSAALSCAYVRRSALRDAAARRFQPITDFHANCSR